MNYDNLPVGLGLLLKSVDEQVESDNDSGPNPYAKFAEDIALAKYAPNAAKDLRGIGYASTWYSRLSSKDDPSSKAPDDHDEEWNTPVTGDALHKRLSASTRKAALADYVRRRLAVGESVASLAASARRHHEGIALLIEEIGREIGAA